MKRHAAGASLYESYIHLGKQLLSQADELPLTSKTMAESMTKTAGPSPERKANLFSIFTWQWVQPFVTLGNKKTIQAEDLYDLLPRERTDYCERMWNKSSEGQTKKNPGKSPSAWKLVFMISGREMLWSYLVLPLWLAAVVSQVFVLKALVELAQNNQEKLQWWRGLLLILRMLVSSAVQSIMQHSSLTNGQKSGMKIRAAISMAVFNKLMQMKTVALGATSSGNMLNLIMNDTQKLVDASNFFAYTTFSIIVCFVVAGIAVGEVGIAALPGVAVVFLAIPVLISIAQGVTQIRRRAVKLTDARVRTIQEILSGVRVVKYNGWTTVFLARIKELRAVEIHWIRNAAFLRATTSTLKEGVAPLATLLMFETYVRLHNGTLSASKAFTLLGLFSIFVQVYSVCPTGVLAIGESTVAIQRLQNLLDLPTEKGHSSKEEVAQIQKIYPNASVAVSEGTFWWHLKNQEGTEASSFVPGQINESKPRISSFRGSAIDSTADVGFGKQNNHDAQNLAIGALKGINLSVSKNELVAVIGPVGSGKSSLIYAILGEMERVKGTVFIEKQVSYAPQQPWILNDTVKNNILFASKYNEARYKNVLFACALDHDLQSLPAGDNTEIGERGVNLSGGQKARVSLARACYSSSKLVLLDDPLAAVDVPTAKHLMQHVLRGILKGRTVILVTHNNSSLDLCDRVFHMESGKLQEVESKGEVIQKILPPEKQEELEEQYSDDEGDPVSTFGNSKDQNQLEEDSPKGELKESKAARVSSSSSLEVSTVQTQPLQVTRKSKDSMQYSLGESGSGGGFQQISTRKSTTVNDDAVEAAKAAAAQSARSLIVHEDRVTGEVTWKTYLQYARGSGLWRWAVAIFLMGFGQAVRVMVDYWVGIWVSHKYNLSTNLYLGIYAVWIVGMVVCILARGLFFAAVAIRSAKSMHSQMAESVLRSPQLFFDQNPVGRLTNRFAKDQSVVDELLPYTAQEAVGYLVGVLGVIVLAAVIMPWFMLSLPPFIFTLWYCQQRYVAVSRELKRLDGLSRSPIYAHFIQTLQGITSVRAYGTEVAMQDHFRDCIDANNRVYILYVHIARWLGVRLDFAATLLVTTTALLAILLRHSIAPGVIGVVLLQSLRLTKFFQYGIRLAAETENYFTSVERNQAYANLPSEADSISPPGLISEEWPEKGLIEYVNYTMAYREDLPPVLNNLTFKILSQEKVGILGRTGAGKSSLAVALFRMVENSACSGSIFIDGINLKCVGLDDLRLRLSIVPQDPVLFRGTVRLNLDPFERHSDIEMFEALAKVQLTAKIKSLTLGLNSPVTENGDNFSVGQRQLLCLARSLLRRSKVIVMDEATAAVDGETDQLIQQTVRSVFHNCTVMTIAHRIETVIDCDRVLVLAEGGLISEFDSPANLLRHAEETNLSEINTMPTEHIFANMVSQAGPIVAKRLRDAVEAAKNQRRARYKTEK